MDDQTGGHFSRGNEKTFKPQKCKTKVKITMEKFKMLLVVMEGQRPLNPNPK
jgi:hypothetical protein